MFIDEGIESENVSLDVKLASAVFTMKKKLMYDIGY